MERRKRPCSLLYIYIAIGHSGMWLCIPLLKCMQNKKIEKIPAWSPKHVVYLYARHSSRSPSWWCSMQPSAVVCYYTYILPMSNLSVCRIIYAACLILWCCKNFSVTYNKIGSHFNQEGHWTKYSNNLLLQCPLSFHPSQDWSIHIQPCHDNIMWPLNIWSTKLFQ